MDDAMRRPMKPAARDLAVARAVYEWSKACPLCVNALDFEHIIANIPEPDPLPAPTGPGWEARFRALVREVEDIDTGFGIYPAAVQGYNDERDYKQRDGFKNGWNACIMKYGEAIGKAVERASAGLSDDLSMLLASGDVWLGDGRLSLNMNDTWAWATAWSEPVPDECVAEVATLFRRYGSAGLLWWTSMRNNAMRSEFHHINRQIDFVAHEERIREETPKSSERAYRKVTYTIGPLVPPGGGD